MSDDQKPQSRTPGEGAWQPVPRGMEYDEGTAFVQLPPELLAHGAGTNGNWAPLAAPGTGYTPPAAASWQQHHAPGAAYPGAHDASRDNGLHGNGLHDNGLHGNGLHDDGLHGNGLHDDGLHQNALRQNVPHQDVAHHDTPHQGTPMVPGPGAAPAPSQQQPGQLPHQGGYPAAPHDLAAHQAAQGTPPHGTPLTAHPTAPGAHLGHHPEAHRAAHGDVHGAAHREAHPDAHQQSQAAPHSPTPPTFQASQASRASQTPPATPVAHQPLHQTSSQLPHQTAHPNDPRPSAHQSAAAPAPTGTPEAADGWTSVPYQPGATTEWAMPADTYDPVHGHAPDGAPEAHATAQWSFAPVASQAGPGSTGQWSVPAAGDDPVEESGEYALHRRPPVENAARDPEATAEWPAPRPGDTGSGAWHQPAAHQDASGQWTVPALPDDSGRVAAGDESGEYPADAWAAATDEVPATPEPGSASTPTPTAEPATAEAGPSHSDALHSDGSRSGIPQPAASQAADRQSAGRRTADLQADEVLLAPREPLAHQEFTESLRTQESRTPLGAAEHEASQMPRAASAHQTPDAPRATRVPHAPEATQASGDSAAPEAHPTRQSPGEPTATQTPDTSNGSNASNTPETAPEFDGPNEHPEATHPEATHRETAHPQAPHPESAHSEATHPEAAQHTDADPAHTDPAHPDATHPDITHPDPADPADLVHPEDPLGPYTEHPCASYVLRVNGTDRPVTDAWIGESLLYVLRERLGLAGAKDGCSQGECGACSVQVDGRLVASCLVPAATTAGSEVRTVEGLAVNGQPSDVQRALADCGAVQCGFCVPGMAMTVHDLLEGNHAPTELETRQALCGNLCRCSGYRGVLRAVRQVVDERAERAAALEEAHPETDTARIPHQAGPHNGGSGKAMA
ncbi:(2Fe-2S)-binding protein [Streptomyces orinoci]|uniref:2Fe-2S iron-sulfur cluster-binding protein n=1 Tax=Streptomyces orinoci TaxID=67339 RepID=A0ABV3K7G1_STRON|nr:2Fe-2S iron-sulfur cluster-binding protein [Streptomyces orinoci]